MARDLFDEAQSMVRDPASGLEIIIVGGGIAGLSFAIEAYRKGHQVTLLERRPDFNDYGLSSSARISNSPILTRTQAT